MANDTHRACTVPNIHMVHYHELCAEFLSQVNVSCDVLEESDLLQETASDVSKNMVHETSITTDSGYHSSHPTVPAHLDASSGTMAPGSFNKVPCPFPKGEAFTHLPGKTDKILSPVQTGHPEVKVPGQMLPSASTLRVNGENKADAASMFASFRESETFRVPSHLMPCNVMVSPTEEKVLPSPIKFPAQSMTASYLIWVDRYLGDHICGAPTHVQHTSTHDYAITSPDEALNCPRLILMAKGQPQKMTLANQSQLIHFEEITRNRLGYPTSGNTVHPNDGLSKRGGGNTNGIL